RPSAQHCWPPLLSRSAGAATPATTRTAPRSMPKRRIQSPSAPATEPTEPETGDESTEEGGQGEKSGATADLGVEDGHVQYLRAIQNFSPALERWVLDEEAGEVTYGIVNCAGQTKSEGVATLERVDGGDGAAFEAT